MKPYRNRTVASAVMPVKIDAGGIREWAVCNQPSEGETQSAGK
jgi:hypothetical protein